MILIGRSDMESVVDPGTAGGHLSLFVQPVSACGRRLRIGHVNDCRHPAEQGRPGFGCEIRLGRQAGLPEMDVGVDPSGQQEFPLQRNDRSIG